MPTVFGLALPLFTFGIREISVPPVLSDKKAWITMIWDTAWLVLTIFIVCNQSGDLEGMRDGSIDAVIMMVGV